MFKQFNMFLSTKGGGGGGGGGSQSAGMDICKHMLPS